MNGKLDLEAVYRIKNKIDSGAEIATLFNSKEISNLLFNVLDIQNVDMALPYESDSYYGESTDFDPEDYIKDESSWENYDNGDDDIPF